MAAATRPTQRPICDRVTISRLATIEDDADAEPDPGVGREVVAEHGVLQVVGQHSVVAERPQRVDDPHQAHESEDGGGEEEPAGAGLLLRVEDQLVALRGARWY